MLRSLCNCEISPLRWPLVFDRGQILTFYVPDHLKKRPNMKLIGQIWNVKAKHRTPLAFGFRYRPNFNLLGPQSPKKEACQICNLKAKYASKKQIWFKSQWEPDILLFFYPWLIIPLPFSLPSWPREFTDYPQT